MKLVRTTPRVLREALRASYSPASARQFLEKPEIWGKSTSTVIEIYRKARAAAEHIEASYTAQRELHLLLKESDAKLSKLARLHRKANCDDDPAREASRRFLQFVGRTDEDRLRGPKLLWDLDQLVAVWERIRAALKEREWLLDPPPEVGWNALTEKELTARSRGLFLMWASPKLENVRICDFVLLEVCVSNTPAKDFDLACARWGEVLGRDRTRHLRPNHRRMPDRAKRAYEEERMAALRAELDACCEQPDPIAAIEERFPGLMERIRAAWRARDDK